MEKSEVDQTLVELEKTAADAVIYKAVGSLLVKAEKSKVTEELTERKSLLDTRSTVMARQEERIRSQVKEAQAKLQEDLSPVSGQPSS
jgi:prefoldin beta subunit